MLRYDALEQFFKWYLQTRPVMPPEGEFINDDGRVIETILFRDGQYQVQECTVIGHSELPDHKHPEVDSYELYMGGDIVFRRNGERFAPVNPGVDSLRIYPDSDHGGTFGARGGVFLSIQQWLKGVEPTFISRNWEFSDTNETCRNVISNV